MLIDGDWENFSAEERYKTELYFHACWNFISNIYTTTHTSSHGQQYIHKYEWKPAHKKPFWCQITEHVVHTRMHLWNLLVVILNPYFIVEVFELN